MSNRNLTAKAIGILVQINKEQIALARATVDRFRWDKIAKDTIELYTTKLTKKAAAATEHWKCRLTFHPSKRLRLKTPSMVVAVALLQHLNFLF